RVVGLVQRRRRRERRFVIAQMALERSEAIRICVLAMKRKPLEWIRPGAHFSLCCLRDQLGLFALGLLEIGRPKRLAKNLASQSEFCPVDVSASVETHAAVPSLFESFRR